MRMGLTVTEFVDLTRNYSMVPVWAEVIADLETPMSVASRIYPRDCVIILESAERGLRVGRYSFICFDPIVVFESRECSYLLIEEGRPRFGTAQDPLAVLQEAMMGYSSPDIEGLPPLLGGCVGYVGYDYVRSIVNLPSLSGPSELPDIVMVVPRCVLAFDHLRHTLVAVVNCKVGAQEPETLYGDAVSELHDLIALCRGSGDETAGSSRSGSRPGSPERASRTADIYKNLSSWCPRDLAPGTSTIDRQTFEESIRTTKRHIAGGEVSQVVLSRRISVPVRSSALAVYRALRSVNPSPYMFLLDFGRVKIVGASPEMMVRLQGREAELRPIAGTRPRGLEPAEDRRLELELLNDAKERAEHIMLVDLGISDLEQVCAAGTVRVEDYMHIERYSHVMHIVSSVKGQLSDEYNQYDLFRAAFPAGTVTGAPRTRAMEIIEEQERQRRGVYAGAVGYFGASGNMDMCIAIRTLIMTGGVAHVQAGAGIVADSHPASEYDEVVNKTRGVMNALELAETGDLSEALQTDCLQPEEVLL